MTVGELFDRLCVEQCPAGQPRVTGDTVSPLSHAGDVLLMKTLLPPGVPDPDSLADWWQARQYFWQYPPDKRAFVLHVGACVQRRQASESEGSHG